jgi:S-adenosylhomocysteine hydrolase
MYAARPASLQLTGKDTLDDAYFTQTSLIDYINDEKDRIVASFRTVRSGNGRCSRD